MSAELDSWAGLKEPIPCCPRCPHGKPEWFEKMSVTHRMLRCDSCGYQPYTGFDEESEIKAWNKDAALSWSMRRRLEFCAKKVDDDEDLKPIDEAMLLNLTERVKSLEEENQRLRVVLSRWSDATEEFIARHNAFVRYCKEVLKNEGQKGEGTPL